MLITTTTIIGIVATASLLLSLVCLAVWFVTVVALISTRSGNTRRSSTYMVAYMLVQDNTEANSRAPESERIYPQVRNAQSFKVLTNVSDSLDMHKMLIALMNMGNIQWTEIVPLSINQIPDGFADALPPQLVLNVKTLA